jgi:cytochrome P450
MPEAEAQNRDASPVGSPTFAFDHHSPEFAQDPVDSLRVLQARCPVARSDQHGGFWVLSRYDDVKRAAADPALFSSALRPDGSRTLHIPRDGDGVRRPPLEVDPPGFVAFRRIVEPMLSPRAVAAMVDGIGRYVDYFLDLQVPAGEMELMKGLATPLPTTVTLDWLGLDPKDWRTYSEAFELMNLAVPGSPELALGRDAMRDLTEVLREEIGARREQPRSDVLSAIANAVVDGERVAAELAIGMTMLVLAGGVSTTADVMAHAVIYLDQHRDVHGELIEDDQLMRTATEEFIRHVTPVTTIGRMATEPCTFASSAIAAGDSVLLAWIGANHDPDAFEDPDETDLRRWPNRHLGFGLGPHRCVGSNLARAMFRAGVRGLLQRIPDFRVVDSEAPTDRSTHNGFVRVNLEFTPTALSGGGGERPDPQFQDWAGRFPGRQAPPPPG